MTALAAIWSTDGCPKMARRCEQMLAAQRIYGPDHSAYWSAESIGLGRCLSAFLPEDVHDTGPVVLNRDVLAADVRVDNREELALELRITNPEAANISDADLLMRSLSRWGEDALDHIVGDYAFAWWREDAQMLVLARDPMGQRPLVYHRGPTFVAASSMAKGLHALPEVPTGPNLNSVANFVALRPETSDATFFVGVNKVRAGHLVRFSRTGMTTRQFWQPESRELRLRNASDYVDAVRAQLDVAVKARLRGAGSVLGTHLSGGLDSAAVTATAARLLDDPSQILAYTAVPRPGWSGQLAAGQFADESSLASAVAALYPNIRHMKLAATGRSPFELSESQYLTAERPVSNPCNAVWLDAILSDASSRGVKILLTGQSGNLSFSYDGMGALSSLYRGGRLFELARLLRDLGRKGHSARALARRTLGPSAPQFLKLLRRQLCSRSDPSLNASTLHPKLAAELLARGTEGGRYTRVQGSDVFEQRICGFAAVDYGNYNIGAVGARGIDLRDPTADRRLVELCLAIPPAEYIRGGEPRSLARRVGADRLPSALLEERRKGYQAADWYEGLTAARTQLTEDLSFLRSVPEVAGLLDLNRMLGLLENLPTGNWHHPDAIAQYRLAVLRGGAAAYFVRNAMLEKDRPRVSFD